MKQADLEDRVRRGPWPSPSPALRDRVLSAAVVAAPSITWSDRIWFSRGWRMAAVGMALTIVVLDQVSLTPAPRASTVPARVLAEAQAIEETGREMGLPANVVASLGQRVLSEASRPQPPIEAASALLRTLEAEEAGGVR